MRHLFYYGPQPTFEFQKTFTWFTRFIIETCIWDEHSHIDVTNTIQQESQIFCCKAIQWTSWQNIKYACPQCLLPSTKCDKCILFLSCSYTGMDLIHYSTILQCFYHYKYTLWTMKKSVVRDQKITMNTILTQIHHLKFSGKYLYSTCLTLCVIMRQPSTHHPFQIIN